MKICEEILFKYHIILDIIGTIEISTLVYSCICLFLSLSFFHEIYTILICFIICFFHMFQLYQFIYLSIFLMYLFVIFSYLFVLFELFFFLHNIV